MTDWLWRPKNKEAGIRSDPSLQIPEEEEQGGGAGSKGEDGGPAGRAGDGDRSPGVVSALRVCREAQGLGGPAHQRLGGVKMVVMGTEGPLGGDTAQLPESPPWPADSGSPQGWGPRGGEGAAAVHPSVTESRQERGGGRCPRGAEQRGLCLLRRGGCADVCPERALALGRP